ncbi:MAG: hypothetical protein H7210_01535, partial [Pyrinomonadaceae bacterium]|nr:hypothetical protein [Phycisphaerales bacterium]
MTRIVVLAVLAAAAIAPTAATAQSNGPRINIELTWEGQPPARISVQTPRGPTDYSVGNQVLRIDQAGSQGVDRNYLIVRYPGVNH